MDELRIYRDVAKVSVQQEQGRTVAVVQFAKGFDQTPVHLGLGADEAETLSITNMVRFDGIPEPYVQAFLRQNPGWRRPATGSSCAATG